MTKKGTILPGLNFGLLGKPFKINQFQQESPLGIDIAEKNALLSNSGFAKKARPRAIVERLPTFMGGGITGPKMEQRRKTTGLEASGLPGYRRGETLRDLWSKLTKTLFQDWSDPKVEQENG
jgi:hypothetical protein